MANIYELLPELSGDEQIFVNGLIKDMNENQAQIFANSYRSRRKDPDKLKLLSLLGFIGIAGIHRFMLGQTGMGLLFLFTGGFFYIGTIIDIVNIKKIAFEYNQKIALNLAIMSKGF